MIPRAWVERRARLRDTSGMSCRAVGRLAVLLLPLLLAACHKQRAPEDIDVAGLVAPLDLAMDDVTTGKPVTAEDFRGETVFLYFGYTNCPDVCPDTLYNASRVLKRLGAAARQVRFLFVTVDPDRDTPPLLARYAALFGPQFEGLRGSPDQLARLARRYRVVYSVRKAARDHPYEVTHSAVVYVFDAAGAARLAISGLDAPSPHVDAIAADVGAVIAHPRPPGLLVRLAAFF